MSKYNLVIGFILCLNLAIAIVNNVGVFEYHPQQHQTWINTIYDALNSGKYGQNLLEGDVSGFDTIILTVKALGLFAISYAFGLVVVPYTFNILGVPIGLAVLLSIPVYLTYCLFLIELLRGTSTGD